MRARRLAVCLKPATVWSEHLEESAIEIVGEAELEAGEHVTPATTFHGARVVSAPATLAELLKSRRYVVTSTSNHDSDCGEYGRECSCSITDDLFGDDTDIAEGRASLELHCSAS